MLFYQTYLRYCLILEEREQTFMDAKVYKLNGDVKALRNSHTIAPLIMVYINSDWVLMYYLCDFPYNFIMHMKGTCTSVHVCCEVLSFWCG